MVVVFVLGTVLAVNAVSAYSTEEVTLTVTKNGETTVRHGSFDGFMTELDNATTGENENAIITIDVNKDFKVGGKGYWEFRNMSPTVTLNFNLNGHTVTATAGNVIQVRTGYKLNVNGADENGKAANAGTLYELACLCGIGEFFHSVVVYASHVSKLTLYANANGTADVHDVLTELHRDPCPVWASEFLCPGVSPTRCCFMA